jgi:hypothetical protein
MNGAFSRYRAPVCRACLMSYNARVARCPGCGLETVEGAAACQSLFHELSAREVNDYRYARFHRMVVDAYSLQHPERYCVSAKSLMAHLGGLCCRFDYGGEPAIYGALQR